MSIFKPEFCYPNFVDVNQFTAASVTLSANWVAADVACLYDHKSTSDLVTSGSNDAATDTILIDLGAVKDVGLIKLLHTNFKELTIAYGTTSACSSGSWSVAGSTLPYYNFEVVSTTPNATACNTTYAADGSSTVAAIAGGTTYYLQYRYWKLTFTTTQVTNAQKFLGELYIGRRMVQLSGIRRYKQSQQDDKEQVLKDFYGVSTYNTVYPVFSAEMSFSRPSDKTVFTRAKSLILYRNNYDFFPTSTLMDDDVSFDMSGSDIQLVTTRGSWHYTSYGQEANGQFDILITETKFIY